MSLFLAALVESVGLRVYWSSVFTLIAEQEGGRAKDQWFARAGMIRAAGTGVGTALAGVLLALASQQAYRGMVLANAVSFLAVAVPVYVIRGLRAPGWAVGVFFAITTAAVATCTAEVTRRVRRRTSRGGVVRGRRAGRCWWATWRC